MARRLIIAAFKVLTLFSGFCWADDEKKFYEHLHHVEVITKYQLARLDQLKSAIVGLELLVAGPYEGYIASRWGHLFVRFVDSNDNPLDDIVLGFIGWVDHPGLDYWKGLSGGYATTARLTTLSRIIEEYAKKEGRPIQRFPLQTDARTRQNSVDLLKHWFAHPHETFRQYKFLTNNCAGALIRFLEAAGFPQKQIVSDHSLDVQIPVDIDDRMLKAGWISGPPRVIPSQPALHQKFAMLLGIKLEALLGGESVDIDTQVLRRAVGQLTPKERKMLTFTLKNLPQAVVDVLKEGARGVSDAQNAGAFSSSIYELCADKACLDQQKIDVLRELVFHPEKKSFCENWGAAVLHRSLLDVESWEASFDSESPVLMMKRLARNTQKLKRYAQAACGGAR